MTYLTQVWIEWCSPMNAARPLSTACATATWLCVQVAGLLLLAAAVLWACGVRGTREDSRE